MVVGIAVFANFGESLVGLYLHEDGGGGSVEATMRAAMQYLTVMCIGFLPFSLTMAYYTTIRSYGETVAPMAASMMSSACFFCSGVPKALSPALKAYRFL